VLVKPLATAPLNSPEDVAVEPVPSATAKLPALLLQVEPPLVPLPTR
jgi:hypothetical protein